MIIPDGKSFLFVCGQHNATLEGTPELVPASLHATAVWTLDISDMRCPQGSKEINDPSVPFCGNTWEARS